MLQKLLQAFERIVMRPYWRLIRGQTLGVQGIVIRSGTEVLLVRQSYAPGWQFPGGGVERSEHLVDALERELLEETGIAIHGAPRLHGIFSNFREFKGDRIVVYVVEHWRQMASLALSWKFSSKGSSQLIRYQVVLLTAHGGELSRRLKIAQ